MHWNFQIHVSHLEVEFVKKCSRFLWFLLFKIFMIFIILSVSFKFLLIFYLYILKFNLQFLMVKLYWVDSIERRFALAQKWRAIWMVEGEVRLQWAGKERFLLKANIARQWMCVCGLGCGEVFLFLGLYFFLKEFFNVFSCSINKTLAVPKKVQILKFFIT